MNHRLLFAIPASALALAAAAAEIPLDDPSTLKFRNVVAEVATYQGHEALQVREPGTPTRHEDKLVVIDHEFGDGTIELHLAGMPGPNAFQQARGFVGVAFHVQDGGDQFEAFYLRPTNGRAEDQERRNHATQYISFPDHPWHKLRKETPSRYEAYADLVLGEWTQVKVTVAGDKARLYLHGNEQPTLLVNDLKLPASAGALGLWIGPGTVAHFRNLNVTPAE